jgi:hypothetical protein
MAVGATRSLAADVAAPAGTGLTPFALEDVRLLDGPFLRAQRLSAAYLLSLDCDRLLHGFRVNAGLTPKAPIYGGWESAPTWTDIHCQGHSLGHYLSGVAFMSASGSIISSRSLPNARRRATPGCCALSPKGRASLPRSSPATAR